jgi:transcriptional regulator with GAF, ATPase, and Fis domain
MADETITQTNVELPATAPGAATEVGLVAVFSESPNVGGPIPLAGRCCLGRDRGADVVLEDPKVSRRHAMLEPVAGGVVITDLGSHNGTFLGGCRLGAPGTLAPVGSTVRVGKTLLRVVGDVHRFRDYPAQPREPLVGGPALDGVRRQIEVLGPCSSPVLVQGETGTGKELTARALHRASGRDGRFVALNCAALAAELVEAELFGHSRGAFSGSRRARTGLFRSAHGGTLLLDEVGDLALGLQAKLLRVVEDGQVRPLGEDEPTSVDVRIIAATNRDLQRRVEQGAFRADLLHRIAASRLVLPPLRDRVEDIPLLAVHFLRPSGVRLSTPAMELLLEWRWPGNVRELVHALNLAVTQACHRGREQIWAEDLPPQLAHPPARPLELAGTADEQLRSQIEAALRRHRGNVVRVARQLGLHRSRLYEAFSRLGIDPARYRESG